MKRIKIFDTTLRDGEQSPGCSMNLTEKIEMARQLEKLGVDVIEAGFARCAKGDRRGVGRREGNNHPASMSSLRRATSSSRCDVSDMVAKMTRPLPTPRLLR